MNSALKAAMVLTLTLSLPSAAFACSCREPTADLIDEANAVFVGEVIAVAKPATNQGVGRHIAKLTVIADFKNATAQALSVRTSSSSASCGVGFSVGRRYLILAYEHEGSLHTGLCTALDAGSELARKLIKALAARGRQ